MGQFGASSTAQQREKERVERERAEKERREREEREEQNQLTEEQREEIKEAVCPERFHCIRRGMGTTPADVTVK